MCVALQGSSVDQRDGKRRVTTTTTSTALALRPSQRTGEYLFYGSVLLHLILYYYMRSVLSVTEMH